MLFRSGPLAGGSSLVRWIERELGFPNSMVDRIVPHTTDELRDRVQGLLGVRDRWPVATESFTQWVLEDRFVAGRPPWQLAGVEFVADVAPFEDMKLRLLNAAHSAIAYLGVVAGWQTVDAAIAQPALRGFIDTMLKREVEPTLAEGSVPAGYRERLLQRFANAALAHRCAQIAMDGSQKMPQRLLGTVRDRLDAGAPVEHLALAVAAWLHFLRGHDEVGERYTVDDPEADALVQVHREAEVVADPQARAALFTRSIAAFGCLADDLRWVTVLAPALRSLRERGVLVSLNSLALRHNPLTTP